MLLFLAVSNVKGERGVVLLDMQILTWPLRQIRKTFIPGQLAGETVEGLLWNETSCGHPGMNQDWSISI